MIFYPNLFFENVQSIPYEVLKEKNIKGIILDVDNTLIDYKKLMPEEIKAWVAKAKELGFQICIVSNSNKRDKISTVARDLSLDYFMCARKPFRKGFVEALQFMKLKAEECVAIGDQIFTDVIGANCMHIVSLYVIPINKKEYWYTKWKRPLEGLIIKHYLKKYHQ